MPPHTTSSAPPVLLLSGATGQIGRQVLRAWLHTGHRVVITLRDPARQWPVLRQWLTQQGAPTAGVECVATDFALPDLGWGAQTPSQLRSVTCVVHLAALWGWQLRWSDANEVNVQGTVRLHAWATQQGITGPFVGVCGFLSQVPGHVDSMGLRHPQVDWAAAARKWGAYEVSKVRAYLTLHPSRRQPGALPVTWVHPATVIGDATMPEVPEQSAVVGILQAISKGVLRLVPGSPAHAVPWVTGQYVARYVVALLLSPDDAMPEHLLMDPASPSLRTSVNLLSGAMGGPQAVGHLPKWLMSALLKLPGVSGLMGASAESLNFIVDTRPDPAASVRWGLRHGIAHPDVAQALASTARHWRQARQLV
jgi:dihydroflavonol-4-reductase